MQLAALCEDLWPLKALPSSSPSPSQDEANNVVALWARVAQGADTVGASTG